MELPILTGGSVASGEQYRGTLRPCLGGLHVLPENLSFLDFLGERGSTGSNTDGISGHWWLLLPQV